MHLARIVILIVYCLLLGGIIISLNTVLLTVVGGFIFIALEGVPLSRGLSSVFFMIQSAVSSVPQSNNFYYSTYLRAAAAAAAGDLTLSFLSYYFEW